ncbi:MAG: GNAT family N-acetyltransferase [Tissierellia bacterium]|nr:GNAT family N-acetyltransferase [Tissierellia bacterium]
MKKLKKSGTKELETERFILRKFKMSDAKDVYNNWASDRDSAKYNAWKIHSSIEITKEYLYSWIQAYEGQYYYNWAIVSKDNKEVVGSISVSRVKKRKKYCEIGYTIAKKLWNRGIATEVLICVINFLTKEEGFKTIRALHDVRNLASGKVMKKAGMKFVKNKLMFFLSVNNFIMKCSVYEYSGRRP